MPPLDRRASDALANAMRQSHDRFVRFDVWCQVIDERRRKRLGDPSRDVLGLTHGPRLSRHYALTH